VLKTPVWFARAVAEIRNKEEEGEDIIAFGDISKEVPCCRFDFVTRFEESALIRLKSKLLQHDFSNDEIEKAFKKVVQGENFEERKCLFCKYWSN
jgi:hypothetical protein